MEGSGVEFKQVEGMGLDSNVRAPEGRTVEMEAGMGGSRELEGSGSGKGETSSITLGKRGSVGAIEIGE